MTEIRLVGPECEDDCDADGKRGKRGKRGHLGPTGPTGPGGGGGTTVFTESPPFVWQTTIEEPGSGFGDFVLANYPTNTIKAMRAGTLAGLQVALSAAMINGSLTISITVNSVPSTLVVVCTAGSNPSGGTDLGSQAYLAGDVIGVHYVADAFADWDAEELLLSAWIEIIQAVP